MKHLFFIFICGPLILLALIVWGCMHPADMWNEYLTFPLWVQIMIPAIAFGGFVETFKTGRF